MASENVIETRFCINDLPEVLGRLLYAYIYTHGQECMKSVEFMAAWTQNYVSTYLSNLGNGFGQQPHLHMLQSSVRRLGNHIGLVNPKLDPETRKR
jgi:hypothetical protein